MWRWSNFFVIPAVIDITSPSETIKLPQTPSIEKWMQHINNKKSLSIATKRLEGLRLFWDKNLKSMLKRISVEIKALTVPKNSLL